MKTITVNEKQFVINPKELPFMTGFGGVLGDIFLKPPEGTVVIKELLMVGTHYVTYHKISYNGEEVWTSWGKEISETDKEFIKPYTDFLDKEDYCYLALMEQGRKHMGFNYVLSTDYVNKNT